MEIKKQMMNCFHDKMKTAFSYISDETFGKLEEIRLRARQPIALHGPWGRQYLMPDGNLSDKFEKAYQVEKEEIGMVLERMTDYSLYAFEEDIKNGFFTLPGGHRVGLTGKAVLDGGKVKTLKNINGLNIRLCHEIVGAGSGVLPYIRREGGLYHTLIVSPPGCGKTTLLRDIIRSLSYGTEKIPGVPVSVVDERSEIAGCYMGIAQNDLGTFTDVLDACPKAWGMMMLLRAMSPSVIAVDEIGLAEDIEAIEYVLNSGVTILCSLHGAGIEDVKNKPGLMRLIEQNPFRIILLSRGSGPGTIAGIYGNQFERIR